MDERLKKILMETDYQNTNELASGDIDTYYKMPVKRAKTTSVEKERTQRQGSVYSFPNRKITQDDFEGIEDPLNFNLNIPKYEEKEKVKTADIDDAIYEGVFAEDDKQSFKVEERAIKTDLPKYEPNKTAEAKESDKSSEIQKKRKKKAGLKASWKIAGAALLMCALGFGIYKIAVKNSSATPNATTEAGSSSTVENYATWNQNDTSLYKSSTSAEIQNRYENRDTFVFFVGQKNDAYSQELVPILNDIANRTSFDSIEYLDREQFGKKDLDSISNVVDMYKAPTCSGDTKIRIPSIVFVRDGETIYVHHGTIPGYDPLDRTMNEAETDELYRVLESAFLVMTGQADTLYTVDESKFIRQEEAVEQEQTDAEIDPEIQGENSAWVDSEAIQEEWQPEQTETYEEPAQTW